MRKKKEEVGIDAEKTLKAVLDSVFEKQELYFKLVEEINSTSKYTSEVGTKIFKMNMSDQLKLLVILAQAGKVSKELCEKYGFDVEEEEE